jgi:Tfp pilus assembly protein PilO
MFTGIIAWIQKYVMIILLAVIAVLLLSLGAFYVMHLKSQNTIDKQDAKLELLQKTVKAYEEGVKNSAEAVKGMKEIKIKLSKLDGKINLMSPGKCMNDYDEQTFIDIFGAYNDGLLEASVDTDK